MKTLFLSSAGIRFPIVKKELLKIFPKPLNKLRLAHIITASKVEENPTFVEDDQKVMEDLGIKVEKYDIDGKNKDELDNELG
jgi:peptidase E